MGNFADIIERYAAFDFDTFFDKVTDADVRRCLERDRLSPMDYLTLLSPRAESFIEQLAQKANSITVRHFGRAMMLFTPLYIANYCVNRCIYCGFNEGNDIPRERLTPDQLRAEAEIIAAAGLKHVLVLTGESRSQSLVSYIEECIRVLRKYFTSIGVEIYPLSEDEYRGLIAAGVDGLTIYQETYDRAQYDKLHPAGPKRDYDYRLDTPERGCRAGMRTIAIGALLGLSDWRRDAFFTGLHGDYLQRNYADVEVGVSPPRVRPQVGGYAPEFDVTDRNLVQYISALRIFMPRCGVTLSTRESPSFRDNMVRLGVTRMSGGVSTAVGGRSRHGETGQFEISDPRSVAEVANMLYEKGYQPVYKDWQTV